MDSVGRAAAATVAAVDDVAWRSLLATSRRLVRSLHQLLELRISCA